MTKQEITDYRFFKSNSSEDIILVDRYNCRVGQQFEYNNTQNKYVIMEGTFIYITQFARDRFGHRITIGQEFGWLEGKAVRLMKNSDPKGEEEIMTPFWSTLPLAELRSYLAADELNLSTAEDIFSWSIKKFWLLKKYPSLQTPDGSFIDPDAMNSKVKDQIKQLASGQLSCHEKGIADKTCFGWNYNNLQLFIVNDPQKTRYTGITRLHYSAKDFENKTVITMNSDLSLYGIVQQLGPAYEDHYIANFIIMNLNSVLNPDQTKSFNPYLKRCSDRAGTGIPERLYHCPVAVGWVADPSISPPYNSSHPPIFTSRKLDAASLQNPLPYQNICAIIPPKPLLQPERDLNRFEFFSFK